jgi:hypothetical protein|nr:MAG TPA: Morphogenesis protein 1 wall, phi29, hydrolase, infection [Caudoviricetes sp.]
MAVTETRARITVVDNATAGLNNIARANEKMMSSLSNGGRSLAQFNTELSKLNSASSKGVSNMADSFDGAAKSVSNMDKMVNRLIYSVMRYTVIYEGIKKMGDLWGTIVGGAYDYANMIETNQIGMAGILSSMTKIDGKQTTWNQAMAVSKQVMKDLQSESLKTAATAQELIDTFRALLGPGLASGMTIKQIEKLTTVGTNAVKSLGLPSNQIIQELRDLVAGGIRPSSSTLATSLGITDADIKAAKQSTEGLYNFLINKMKGFEMATTQTSNTVAGKLDQIKEGLQRGIAEGMSPLRDVYSDILGDIAKKLVVIDKTTYQWQINPAFTSALTDVSVTIMRIGESLKSIWETSSPYLSIFANAAKGVFGSIVNNLGLVVAGFAAFKTKDILNDLANIATMNRFDYNAQTSIGKAIQGIRDKITGRIEKHKEELALQEREKALVDGAVESYARMLHTAENAYAYVKTLNAMSNAPGSITNLAAKWQGMGMSEAEAVARQNNIVGLANKYGMDGYDKYIKQAIEAGDKAAEQIKAQNDLLKAQEAEQERILKLYDEQMKSIDKIVSAERDRKLQVKDTANAELAAIDKMAKAVTHNATRGDKAKSNVDAYLSLDTSNGPYKTKEGKYVYAWEQDEVDKLRTALEKLGYQYEVVQVTSERFMDSLHASMKGKVNPVFEQAINSARLWDETLTKAYQGVNMSASEINFKAFMGMGNELVPAEQKNTAKLLLNEISDEFKQVGMSAQEAQAKALEFVNQFILSLQKIDPKNIFSVTQVIAETQDAAQRYAENFRLVAEHTEEVKQASAEAAIEINALGNAFKIGGEESYQAVRRVVEESKNLQQALMDRGAEEQAIEVHKELANYLTQVAEATDKAVIATKDHMNVTAQATEAITAHTQVVNEHGISLESVTDKTIAWMGKIAGLSMSLGILMHLVAENSDENKTLANTMADVADKVFIGAMAVGSLLDVFKNLVENGPAIIKTLEGIGKARLFAEHPILTGVGLVGAAVGGFAWKMLDNGHNQYESKSGIGLDYFERQGLDFSNLSDTAKQYRAHGDGSYDNGDNSGWDIYSDESSNYAKGQAIANEADAGNTADRMTTDVKPDAGSSKGGGKAPKATLDMFSDAVQEAVMNISAGMNYNAAIGMSAAHMFENADNTMDYYPERENEEGSGAHGIGMWMGSRLTGLHEYAGSDYNDKYAQMGYARYEVMQGDESSNFANVDTSSPEAAAVSFERNIERPGNDVVNANAAQLQENARALDEAVQNALSQLGMDVTNMSKISQTMKRDAERKHKIDEAKIKTASDIAALDEATKEAEGGQLSAYQKVMDAADKKVKQYEKDLESDKKLGVNTDSLSKAITAYTEAMEKQAWKAQQLEDMKDIQNTYKGNISYYKNASQATNGEISADDARSLMTEQLESYRDYLKELYNEDFLNAQQRAEVWQELANTQKQITENQMYNYRSQWESALDSMKQEGINFGQLSKDIVGHMQSATASFFTTTGNLATRLKATLKNLASSVLSSLAQIAAKMMIFKALGIPFGGSSSSSAESAWGNRMLSSLSFKIGGNHATGGDVLAGSSYIVGERGPELLTMGRNDGHVFPSVPTSNAQTAQPIQIVVNNNTGTNMKAESTTTVNHGQMLKTIVLTTVEEALSTNEAGLRDMVTGLR